MGTEPRGARPRRGATTVTPATPCTDTVDWAALCRTARKIAARYVPPQDVDDIVQNALVELVRKNNNGNHNPARASRQTYLMVSLRYAVLGAISAYLYESYDLKYEECRDAFRKWDGADPADIVATLTARYIKKGYSKATAVEKGEKIAQAISKRKKGTLEQTMSPEWWAQHGVAP